MHRSRHSAILVLNLCIYRHAPLAAAQFAKKLEAKGERKSTETAAAFKKLQDMQARIRPQAERCKDKLTMLMQKQTLDLERWLLRYTQAMKGLNDQSTQALAACLKLEERMLISQAGARRRRAVDRPLQRTAPCECGDDKSRV